MKMILTMLLAIGSLMLPSCITVIPGGGGGYGGGGPGYGGPPQRQMPPQMRPPQQRPMPMYGGGYPQQRPVYGGGGYPQPRPSYGGQPNYVGGGYNSPPPQYGRRNPIYRDWNQSTVAPPGYRQGPITYDPNRRY